jgi:hypothetical protein
MFLHAALDKLHEKGVKSRHNAQNSMTFKPLKTEIVFGSKTGKERLCAACLLTEKAPYITKSPSGKPGLREQKHL